MTLENAITYTIETLKWKEQQSPDKLTKEIGWTIDKLTKKEFLERHHRRLIGFCLFTYSMFFGPSTFVDVADCAEEIGVLSEVAFYSNDYQRFAQKQSYDAALFGLKYLLHGSR